MAKIGGRLLVLEIDGTDYSDQVSNAVVTSADSDADFLSYAAARAGGKDYKLVLTIAQDLATGSLWREIYDNVGDTVPFTMAPYGNATASTAEPHIEGNAVIKEPDGNFVGGESNRSTTAVQTVEVEWDMPARFTLVTA